MPTREKPDIASALDEEARVLYEVAKAEFEAILRHIRLDVEARRDPRLADLEREEQARIRLVAARQLLAASTRSP